MMPDPHPDQSAQASAQRRQEKQRLFRHPPHLLTAHLAFGLPFVQSKHQKCHHIDDDQPNCQHTPGAADQGKHPVVGRLRQILHRIHTRPPIKQAGIRFRPVQCSKARGVWQASAPVNTPLCRYSPEQISPPQRQT